MANDIIQADYEVLQDVAGKFDHSAEFAQHHLPRSDPIRMPSPLGRVEPNFVGGRNEPSPL